MRTTDSEIQTVFDADNHYWEVSDSFTRYRDAEFADRGVVLKEIDGKPHYFFGERAASDHPRSRRRPPPTAAGRALRLLRGEEQQGTGRQRARLRGSRRAPGVVRS